MHNKEKIDSLVDILRVCARAHVCALPVSAHTGVPCGVRAVQVRCAIGGRRLWSYHVLYIAQLLTPLNRGGGIKCYCVPILIFTRVFV
jgi:hypothetical protein